MSSPLHGSLLADSKPSPSLATPLVRDGNDADDDELDLLKGTPPIHSQLEPLVHTENYTVEEFTLDATVGPSAHEIHPDSEPEVATAEHFVGGSLDTRIPEIDSVVANTTGATSGERGSTEPASDMNADPSVRALSPRDLINVRTTQDAMVVDEEPNIAPVVPDDAPSHLIHSTYLASHSNHSFIPAVLFPTKRPVIVLSTESSEVPEPAYIFAEPSP